MYEITDKKLRKLRIKTKKLFSRNQAVMLGMGFDSLNVIRKCKKLYSELNKMNELVFLEIANEVYQKTFPESDRKLDSKWLLGIVAAYDPVTKYVYKNEVERKRSRFIEAVIASKSKRKEFMTALNLWWKQTEQYADTVTDMAVIEAFYDKGSKEVVWNTNMDGKECDVCKSRHKKVYPIDDIPSKPHYGCRCYFTPKGGG